MITDTDKGLAAILRGDEALNNRAVAVGIMADAGNIANGADLLDIAIYNEFGTEHIPSRPFIGSSHLKYEHDAEVVMRHLAVKVGEGAPVDMALNTLGQWYESKVKGHAKSGEFVPNAPATIRAKGSSVPLVDTGAMIGAIRYEVR